MRIEHNQHRVLWINGTVTAGADGYPMTLAQARDVLAASDVYGVVQWRTVTPWESTFALPALDRDESGGAT